MKNTFTKKLFLSCCLLAVKLSISQSYCMLPGRTPYATIQPGIVRFKLNKVDRTSSNVESLSSVVVTTGLTDSLVQTKVYTVTIMHTWDSVNFSQKTNNIRIYIDLNQDWDYTDAGETVLAANFIPAGTFTGTFSIPVTSSVGLTGMRVTAKMSQDLGHTAPTPCDNPADALGYHGEMEDYWLHIAALPNLAGISEQQEPVEISLWPNPASETLFLHANLSAAGSLKVELFDITGKKINAGVNVQNMNAGDNRLEIPIGQLDNGIYFVQVSTGSGTSRHKIVISR